MSDPIRLRDLPPEAQGAAERGLSLSEQALEWPLEHRVAAHWAFRARLADRSRAQRFHLGWVTAGAAAALAALFLAAAMGLQPPRAATHSPVSVHPGAHQPGWERVDIAGIGAFELSRAARFEVNEPNRELLLQAGTLRAQVQPQSLDRTVIVSTPHLRVVVGGTRFDVVVDSNGTSVEVIEGLVRVERGAASVLIPAGAAIDSRSASLNPTLGFASVSAPSASTHSAAGPNLTLAPKALLAPPAALPARPAGRLALPGAGKECERLRGLERQKRCFRRQSENQGLAAQTALVALAQLARDVEDEPSRALEYLRLHELRFPNGALAPEVALGVLATLAELGRGSEAVAAATSFEQRFPGDPRAGEVALVRAELLCSRAEHTLEALAILEQLQLTGGLELRELALRARARCGTQAGPDPLPLLWGAPTAHIPF